MWLLVSYFSEVSICKWGHFLNYVIGCEIQEELGWIAVEFDYLGSCPIAEYQCDPE